MSLAYRRAGEKAGVSISVERSRSGNGAHAWIFFAEPVPAVSARRLGALLLAKAGANATRAWTRSLSIGSFPTKMRSLWAVLET